MYRSIAPVIGVLLLVAAAPALAQIDPDPDGIGFYFDPDATVNQIYPELGLLVGYVCLTHPTASTNIAGCELSFHPDPQGPGFVMLAIQYPFLIIDPPDPPDVRWDFESGLPSAPVVVLVTVEMFVFGSEPTYFRIGPYSTPEGGILGNYLPAYRPTGSDIWRPMIPSSGNIDEPVAVINGEAPIAAERRVWSRVKELYR